MIGSKPTDSGRAPQAVEQSALMEALIKATEQLLTEMRPEAISTIRIASRAGVSIGTLMQLFRNKDAIVAEAMARRRRAERAAAAPPTASTARPPSTVPSRPSAGGPASSLPPRPPAPAQGRPPGVPPSPPVTSRNPTPPPVPPPRPAPPPAAMLFRKPAPAPAQAVEPESRPAIARLPEPPAPPAAPAAPREALEDAMASVVRPLVAAFAALVPALPGMPQAERDAKTRAELRRMAAASEAMLARQNVPDPPHVAYVMTLTCDRVIKDAIRSAPESFSDGRLEAALCRLCIDFVRSG